MFGITYTTVLYVWFLSDESEGSKLNEEKTKLSAESETKSRSKRNELQRSSSSVRLVGNENSVVFNTFGQVHSFKNSKTLGTDTSQSAKKNKTERLLEKKKRLREQRRAEKQQKLNMLLQLGQKEHNAADRLQTKKVGSQSSTMIDEKHKKKVDITSTTATKVRKEGKKLNKQKKIAKHILSNKKEQKIETFSEVKKVERSNTSISDKNNVHSTPESYEVAVKNTKKVESGEIKKSQKRKEKSSNDLVVKSLKKFENIFAELDRQGNHARKTSAEETQKSTILGKNNATTSEIMNVDEPKKRKSLSTSEPEKLFLEKKKKRKSMPVVGSLNKENAAASDHYSSFIEKQQQSDSGIQNSKKKQTTKKAKDKSEGRIKVTVSPQKTKVIELMGNHSPKSIKSSVVLDDKNENLSTPQLTSAKSSEERKTKKRKSGLKDHAKEDNGNLASFNVAKSNKNAKPIINQSLEVVGDETKIEKKNASEKKQPNAYGVSDKLPIVAKDTVENEINADLATNEYNNTTTPCNEAEVPRSLHLPKQEFASGAKKMPKKPMQNELTPDLGAIKASKKLKKQKAIVASPDFVSPNSTIPNVTNIEHVSDVMHEKNMLPETMECVLFPNVGFETSDLPEKGINLESVLSQVKATPKTIETTAFVSDEELAEPVQSLIRWLRSSNKDKLKETNLEEPANLQQKNEGKTLKKKVNDSAHAKQLEKNMLALPTKAGSDAIGEEVHNFEQIELFEIQKAPENSDLNISVSIDKKIKESPRKSKKRKCGQVLDVDKSSSKTSKSSKDIKKPTNLMHSSNMTSETFLTSEISKMQQLKICTVGLSSASAENSSSSVQKGNATSLGVQNKQVVSNTPKKTVEKRNKLSKTQGVEEKLETLEMENVETASENLTKVPLETIDQLIGRIRNEGMSGPDAKERSNLLASSTNVFESETSLSPQKASERKSKINSDGKKLTSTTPEKRKRTDLKENLFSENESCDTFKEPNVNLEKDDIIAVAEATDKKTVDSDAVRTVIRETVLQKHEATRQKEMKSEGTGISLIGGTIPSNGKVDSSVEQLDEVKKIESSAEVVNKSLLQKPAVDKEVKENDAVKTIKIPRPTTSDKRAKNNSDNEEKNKDSGSSSKVEAVNKNPTSFKNKTTKTSECLPDIVESCDTATEGSQDGFLGDMSSHGEEKLTQQLKCKILSPVAENGINAPRRSARHIQATALFYGRKIKTDSESSDVSTSGTPLRRSSRIRKRCSDSESSTASHGMYLYRQHDLVQGCATFLLYDHQLI